MHPVLAILIALFSATPSPGPTTLLEDCTKVQARLDVSLDSGMNASGDSFGFTLLGAATLSDGTRIAAGAHGRGVLAFVQSASSGGAPGVLVLEPRYVVTAKGRHVPVIGDPSAADRIGRGKTKDVPGALGLVPGVGLAVGGYNALHHGKNIRLGKGVTFSVLLGDDLAEGGCYISHAMR